MEENIVIESILSNENCHSIAFQHFHLERKTQTKSFLYTKYIFQMNAIDGNVASELRVTWP